MGHGRVAATRLFGVIPLVKTVLIGRYQYLHTRERENRASSGSLRHTNRKAGIGSDSDSFLQRESSAMRFACAVLSVAALSAPLHAATIPTFKTQDGQIYCDDKPFYIKGVNWFGGGTLSQSATRCKPE